jgi:PadR family transcriptional regulator PadR
MAMILAVLHDGERHGYDIGNEVDRRSGERIQFNDGTLYPLLHALEKEGLIVSHWEQPVGERKRRVYALTESGEAELQRKLEAWRDFSRAVDQVLLGG